MPEKDGSSLKDQRIGINTTSPLLAGAIVGHGVTSALSDVVIPGAGTTTTFTFTNLNGVSSWFF